MFSVKLNKQVLKFINSLPNSSKIKEKLSELQYFKTEKVIHLDIKRFRGTENFFRLRMGKIRFIFEVFEDSIYVRAVDYRGKVYK